MATGERGGENIRPGLGVKLKHSKLSKRTPDFFMASAVSRRSVTSATIASADSAGTGGSETCPRNRTNVAGNVDKLSCPHLA